MQRESRELKGREQELDDQVSAIAAELRDLMLRIPNTPAADAPDGADETANVVVRVEDFDPDGYADYQRVPHWETGAALGILDVETGVKVSGSMFVMLRGAGATVSRAVVPARPRPQPGCLRGDPPAEPRAARGTLTATGPAAQVRRRRVPRRARPPLGHPDRRSATHVDRDATRSSPEADLPAGSWPTRRASGVRRGRPAVTPAASCACTSSTRSSSSRTRPRPTCPVPLEEILGRAEALIRDLGLAHRVLDICTGDLGQSHHRSFDIEIYAPGVDQWLEVSSVSWFSDYQARRANIRYRPAGGGGTELVHTLNGSALAAPRVLAGLLETHRQADGSVVLPEVLGPYLPAGLRLSAPAVDAAAARSIESLGGRLGDRGLRLRPRAGRGDDADQRPQPVQPVGRGLGKHRRPRRRSPSSWPPRCSMRSRACGACSTTRCRAWPHGTPSCGRGCSSSTWALALPAAAVIVWPWIAETTR